MSVTSTTAHLSQPIKELISKNPQAMNKIRQIVETARGSLHQVPEYRQPAMKWMRKRGEDIVQQLQQPGLISPFPKRLSSMEGHLSTDTPSDTQRAIMVSAASFAVSKAAFYCLGFGPLGPVAGPKDNLILIQELPSLTKRLQVLQHLIGNRTSLEDTSRLGAGLGLFNLWGALAN